MKCCICSTNTEPGQQYCGFCGVNLKEDQSNPPEPTNETAAETSKGQMLPAVSFGSAITLGFQNFFNFNGRSRRSEYWWWQLFAILVGFIPILGGFIALVLIIPGISVTARRLHDIGKSGWLQLWIWLIVAVPWVIFFIYMLSMGSDEPEGKRLDSLGPEEDRIVRDFKDELIDEGEAQIRLEALVYQHRKAMSDGFAKGEYSQEIYDQKHKFFDSKIQQGISSGAEPSWKIILSFGVALFLFSVSVGVYWIVLMARDGGKGTNKYGQNPKAIYDR